MLESDVLHALLEAIDRYSKATDTPKRVIFERAGVSYSVYSQLRSKPNKSLQLGTLMALAKVLGVSPASFFRNPPASSEDVVNHPKHYTSHPSGIEAFEVARHMDFPLGSVWKYVFRHQHKGRPVEDVDKALWYASTLTERPSPTARTFDDLITPVLASEPSPAVRSVLAAIVYAHNKDYEAAPQALVDALHTLRSTL
jgi:transcriptional regulator with XRE-family HTH domain